MKKYFMPVGDTNFGEIRKSGLYYIDKTMLIAQLSSVKLYLNMVLHFMKRVV